MSFATTRAHLARAALEATANSTRDLMDAFAADGAPWASLRIDGGMSANDWLAQDLANILGIAVERPEMVETTALGAAMLGAVGSGWFGGLDEAAAAMRGPVVGFAPGMDAAVKDKRLRAWREAVAKV